MSRGSGRRPPHHCLLGHPEAESAWVKDVSVDVRPMKQEVQRGLSRLARAPKTITVGDAVQHNLHPPARRRSRRDVIVGSRARRRSARLVAWRPSTTIGPTGGGLRLAK